MANGVIKNILSFESIDIYSENLSANGCTCFGKIMKFGCIGIAEGTWKNNSGLTKPNSFISNIPDKFRPAEEIEGSGMCTVLSNSEVLPAFPTIQTNGSIYEASTSNPLKNGSFCIIYKCKN